MFRPRATSRATTVALALFVATGCGESRRPPSAPDGEVQTSPRTEPTRESGADAAVRTPVEEPEPTPEQIAARDRALVRAVRNAVARGATPENIEELVGERATLNTHRPRDRGVLSIVDLSPLPPTTDRGAMRWVGAYDVAYWALSGEWENPRIIGVAWRAGDEVESFEAEILPP